MAGGEANASTTAALNAYLDRYQVRQAMAEIVEIIIGEMPDDPISRLKELLGKKGAGLTLVKPKEPVRPDALSEQLKFTIDDAITQATIHILEERPTAPLTKMAEFFGATEHDLAAHVIQNAMRKKSETKLAPSAGRAPRAAPPVVTSTIDL